MKYLTALALALLCSASIAAEHPVIQLDKYMLPEYVLVTDFDGHIRRVSDVRGYPDNQSCETGWREIQPVAGFVLCGKPIR